MSRNTLCNSLDKLSAEGNWDDVFYCLQIDANSTIELATLRALQSNEEDDAWLDNYRATANSLEVILAVILLFDQIFYIALLWYLVMFACKLVRHRGLDAFRALKSNLVEMRFKPRRNSDSNKLNPLRSAASAFGLGKAAAAARKQQQMRDRN